MTEVDAMARRANEHIQEAFDLCRQLITLADEGEADCEDNGCVALYGLIRDCAYRMRREAEREHAVHIAGNVWDETHRPYEEIDNGR